MSIERYKRRFRAVPCTHGIPVRVCVYRSGAEEALSRLLAASRGETP
jgi:hypothetical protein